MTYLISYDLNKPGKNYEDLYEAIKGASNGVWCKPLRSVYIIKSNLSVKSIYDRLATCLDTTDRVLVIEVTRNAYWYLDTDISKHLQLMLNQ